MEARYNYIKKKIQELDLRPASKRKLPLFTLSCIALGYNKSLKKYLNSSLNGIAAIGGNGEFHALMNEKYLGESVNKFLNKNSGDLDKLFFLPAIVIFEKVEAEIKKIRTSEDIINNLKTITKIYSLYMESIGIYNFFWRYLGDGKTKKKLSKNQISKISQERNKIAKLYPKIEELIKKQVNLIKKLDGDLLRYFTLPEMKNYLKKQEITEKKLETLKQRKKKYFYIFLGKENKEEIIIDEDIIKAIDNDFYKIDNKDVSLIKGYSAYKGIVKGFVYNMDIKSKKNKPEKDFVLVANTTHPKDIAIIKQSKAIITDEGGILSHASVISRELKIPCIMGTKIATEILKDGDLVEVDANKGIVKIIK